MISMAKGYMAGDVGYLMADGITQLNVYCENLACRHRGTVQLAVFKPEIRLQAIKDKLKCSVCGGTDIDVIPDWSPLQPTQRGYPG